MTPHTNDTKGAPTLRQVGISGLGRMGSAIAGRLLDKGFTVSGFDVDSGRVAALSGMGGRATGSNRELGESAEVILTCLPSADALAEVLEGPDAVLAGGDPKPVIVETSTLAPWEKEAAYERARAAGFVMLDCPLSGGPPAARAGQLALFASGDEASVQWCTSLFEAMAHSHHFVGEFGMGSKMKLLTNLLVAVHNASTAEVLTLGEKAGIEPRYLCDVLATTSGDSKMLRRRGPMMAAGEYDSVGGISVQLFDKDLRLIQDYARSLDCPVPLFRTTRDLYAAALADGLGDRDSSSVHLVLQRLAGLGEPSDGR